jgi:hypothetical protein
MGTSSLRPNHPSHHTPQRCHRVACCRVLRVFCACSVCPCSARVLRVFCAVRVLGDATKRHAQCVKKNDRTRTHTPCHVSKHSLHVRASLRTRAVPRRGSVHTWTRPDGTVGGRRRPPGVLHRRRPRGRRPSGRNAGRVRHLHDRPHRGEVGRENDHAPSRAKRDGADPRACIS